MQDVNWRAEPSERELFFCVALGAVLFVMTTGALHGHSLTYGDNGAYLEVATAIRHWDFHGLTDVQHFMGYPYAIAAVSLVLRVPLSVSLLLVSGAASLTSTLLIARLFGTRVAGYFAVSNFAWLQASFLGGSEPLAVALGMGAFWNFRRGNFVVAAFLGALATIVRPLMICTLLGIGLVLLCRRQYTQFLGALGVGLAIGVLYAFSLAHYYGDPFLTVHSYTSRDYGATNISGPHGRLFSWPLYAIIMGTLTYPAPLTNLVLSFSWIALVLAGLAAMFSRNFRGYLRAYPAEAVFCGLYLLMIFCYGYLVWARSNFMRFAIPALPFIFYALLSWLPQDRRVLWCLSVIGPLLAACSAVGIKNLSLFP